MTVSIDEKHRGTTGSSTGWKIDYVVRATGSDSTKTEFQLAELVGDAAPSTITDSSGSLLILADVQLTEFNDTTVGPIAFYSAIYGPPEEGSPLGTGSFGDATFDFNYQAPSVHLDYAIATRQKASDDFFPLTDGPEFDDAIIVRYENGRPIHEGIDTPAGNTTHTFGISVPSGAITSAYQNTVLGLMGAVNSSTFKGAAAGTVRFVQCQSQTSGGKTRISWGFQFSPNRTGLTIAGISGIDIGGHEIYWGLDMTTQDPESKHLRIQTAVVYVQQIFPLYDLNLLGL